MKWDVFLKLGLILFLGLFFTQPILASNGRTTYQGKIYKPDGYPLEAASVAFRFTVLDPSGSCVLYIEDYPGVNMVGSGGFISLSLGMGSRAYPTSGTLTFAQVFDNTVPMFTCQTPGFYNPTATDNRKLVMQFNDTNGWQTLPAMAINAVPYAMYADKSTDAAKLNGKADTDFVEVTTLANLNCTAGQAIQYTGSGFACIDAGDPNAVTNFAVSGSVLTLAGTASSPILGITAASASTDGYLLSSDYNEFKAKMDSTAAAIASALGYSPVSAAAVSSMISSATDPSFTTMSNSISTLQSDLAAVSASAGNALVKSNNLSDLASATVARTNLGLGDLSILNVIDLSTTQATGIIDDARLQDFVSIVSGTQYTKLTVDGKGRVVSGAQLDSSDVIAALGYTPGSAASGITSFNGSSSQTQTLANSLTGTTPAFVTNNGVHTLNIPYASEATTTAGLISNFEYSTFMNKITSSAASIAQVLGYVPAASSTVDALQAQLDAVSGTAGNALVKSNNLSDLASATVARTNLGLGDLSILNVIDLSTSQATGIIADARLQDFVSVVSGTQYTKLTVDGKGRVVSGAQLDSSDVIAALGYTPGSAASGITSFNGSSSQTQTLANSLTGTTPAFVTNNGVHTLNIPYASEATTTAGLISNSEYSTFMNKITSSAASIAQVLGYVPAASSTVDALQAQLDAVSGTAGNALVKSNNLSDLASATVARTNLGLGDLSILNVIDLSTTQATGIIADARLQDFVSVVSGTQYTKLTVDGKGRVVSGAQLDSSDVTTALGYTPAESGTITSSQWTTSGSAVYYNAGNVGIGTANPVAPLDVSGNVRVTGNVNTAGNFSINGNGALQASSNILSIAENANWLAVKLSTSGTERMRIDSSGNVGIGTSTPITKLSVSGGIQISMESATCAVSYAGAMRYNAGSLEFCNGSTWAALGVAGSGVQSFNGSTSGTQSFANSLTGTTPAFVTNNGVHTLNIPYASEATTTAGLISNSEYSTFMNKITSSAASIAQVLGYVPAASSTVDALQAQLDAVSGTAGNALVKSNNLSDLASATVARTNLGLGDLSILNVIDLSTTQATGIIADARLQDFVSVVSGTQYTKLTIDGKGRVVSGAQLDSSDVTTALGYTPAESGTITSSQWTTSGSAVYYNAGNVGIGTATPITKLSVSGGIQISMESATCAVSYAGTIRYNAGSVQFCDGGSWSTLGIAGAGITNFNGSTSGTQSFANALTGTTPAFVTANGVHTLNIPYASEGTTTAGLISNSDYVSFSNKITSSAASIAQVLGYVPASATALGDYLVKTNNLSDLTSSATARSNLGLGGFATISSLDLGSASATGTLSAARMPALNGDVTTVSGSVAATVAAIRGVTVSTTVPTSGQVLAYNGSTWAPATNAASQWNTSGTTINYMAGNVGIGDASPIFKLSISGTASTADRKIGINGTQVLYLPDQSGSGFTGSLFIGNGGQSVSHTSGVQGYSNTGVGIAALFANTTGYRNTANGYRALYLNTTGSNNTANGNEALYTNTTGYNNTAHGSAALYSNTTGNENTATGMNALYSNTTGNGNMANGFYALFANTTGSFNLALGYAAMQSNKTGMMNTGVAGGALLNNTTGSYNVAIGYSALRNNTTGNNNTANGQSALNDNTTAGNNTANGYYALYSNQTKSESTAIGYRSMYYADSVSAAPTISYNTALGAYSLQGSTTPASNTGLRNTALGHSALMGMTSGSNNIGVGYNAGSAITTGSNNIVIGSNNGSAIATSSNNILIADGAGNERLRVDSSGNVGIGTSTPVTKLEVSGGIRISMESATCAVSYAGTIRYNAGNMEYCNGTTWGAMGGGEVTSAAVISALSYTPANSATVNTVATDLATLSGTVTSMSASQWSASGSTIKYTTSDVGIGTSSPASVLHVVDNSPVMLTVENSTSGNTLIEFKNTIGSMFAGIVSGTRNFGIGTTNNLAASSILNVSASGTVGIGATPTTSNTLTVSGNMTTSGRMIASVVANANALTSITADFTNTNFIRATAASNNCGTLNITNTSPGGTFTITIPNATATCTTINWNGAPTNVKLPLGYGAGGMLVSGVIYSFVDDGAYLWVSYVPY